MAPHEAEQLSQTVRQNRALLFAAPTNERPWDYLVVTASTPRQAALYAAELADRKERGLIPPGSEVLSVSDPPGHRVGSGGGLLSALRAVARQVGGRRWVGALAGLATRRIVVIHSGGDSRRSPLHTAAGKLFARLPVELPDGRASTVFDELWALLRPLAGALPAGIMAASGDVLLAFDPGALVFPPTGVASVACWADVATATQHGVYLPGPNHEVLRFLQKSPPGHLRAAGAVQGDGRVAVDSGLMAFVGPAALVLCGLARPAPRGEQDLLALACDRGQPLDLYTHFPAALLRDPPPTVGVEVPPALSEALAGTEFRVLAPDPSRFVHLGSTRLFRDALARDETVRSLFGFGQIAEATLGDSAEPRAAVVMASALDRARLAIRRGAVVSQVEGKGRLVVGQGALVSQVDTGSSDVEVRPGMVLMTCPVRAGETGGDRLRGEVAPVFGVSDDPRQPLTSPQCTFCGVPLLEWLRARRIAQETIWPGVPRRERTLWNAKLFPFAGRGATPGALDLALWMPEGPGVSRRSIGTWRKTVRFALADLARIVDPGEVKKRAERRTARIATAKVIAEIERTGNEEIARRLLNLPGPALARAVGLTARYARSTSAPLRRCRTLAALAGVAQRAQAWRGQRASSALRSALSAAAEVGERAPLSRAGATLSRAAFTAVREAVAQGAPCVAVQDQPPRLALDLGQAVIVDAPVRIDLAGGWTDTPPYCLEHGGAVVNVALNLDGRPPIKVTATPLAESVVRLVSEDQGGRLETTSLRPLLSYARPGDPLAILKAALFCSGVLVEDPRTPSQLQNAVGRSGLTPFRAPSAASPVESSARNGRGSPVVPPRAESRGGALLPRPPPLREQLRQFGSGVELRLRCNVPQGSGLGASSIVGAAVLAALARLSGREPSQSDLLEEVLQLEQMLTTGGGWQDQVGGMVGGLKLTCSDPGVPQRLRVERIDLAPEVWEELGQRMFLFYTGRTRVAKNILQVVMGRYMSREPSAVQALRRIHELALDVAQALREGDLNAVGRLMSAQWECNRILDPESTDAHIDRLFGAVRPYVAGAKLAGAGGGGFMGVMRGGAAQAASAASLTRQLAHLSPEGRMYRFEVNQNGLQVRVSPVTEDGP